MKFQDKFAGQRNSIEQGLLDCCSSIIREIPPGTVGGSSELRIQATKVYRELLGIDSDEGDGHVRALELRNRLEKSLNSYISDPALRGSEPYISLDPSSIESQCRTLLSIPKLLETSDTFHIFFDVPQAYQGLGYSGFSSMIQVERDEDYFFINYTEMLQSCNVPFYYKYSHAERGVAKELKTCGIHVVLVNDYIDEFDEDTQCRLQDDKQRLLKPGEVAVLMARHPHEGKYGYEYQLFLEVEGASKAFEVLRAIQRGIVGSPREELFNRQVAKMGFDIENPETYRGEVKSVLKVNKLLEKNGATVGVLDFSGVEFARQHLQGIRSRDEYVNIRFTPADVEEMISLAGESRTLFLLDKKSELGAKSRSSLIALCKMNKIPVNVYFVNESGGESYSNGSDLVNIGVAFREHGLDSKTLRKLFRECQLSKSVKL